MAATLTEGHFMFLASFYFKTAQDHREEWSATSDGTTGYWHLQEDNGGRSCSGSTAAPNGENIDPNTGALTYDCAGNVLVSRFQSDNHLIAVPVNQWFLVEVYVNRSLGNDGRTYIAINGQTLADLPGPNYGALREEVSDLGHFGLYPGYIDAGNLPVATWFDDWLVRDSAPCATLPCGANGTGVTSTVAVPPGITSPHGYTGTVGVPFSHQVAAVNSPTSFSASGLPGGLSINSSTGVISGTPATAGTTRGGITALNSAGHVFQTEFWTIYNPATSPPTISSLTANPSSINAGGWSQLQWVQSGATTMTLNPGNINVTGQDPFPVNPSTTTTYNLTATNTAGSANRSVTVIVTGTPGLPVISSFAASPAIIALGGSSTLAWTTSGVVTSLSIDQGVGVVTGSSKPVSPSATTRYTLTAANGAGFTSAQTTVTVGTLPAIASFTSSSATVTGSPLTLSWSVSGSTSLSINNGVGTVTGTSVSVTPTATITYVLTATNATGAVTRSLTLWKLPVISSFAATPSSVTFGTSSTLSWVTSGATSLSINQGVGTVSGSSSVSVSPITTTVYTLSASNPGGTTTGTVTVTVTASLPAIASFTVTPSSIISGSSATLSWSVTGATSLSLDNGIGTVSGTSHSVSPVVNTTYVLTATNGTGPVTASVSIVVVPAVCH